MFRVIAPERKICKKLSTPHVPRQAPTPTKTRTDNRVALPTETHTDSKVGVIPAWVVVTEQVLVLLTMTYQLHGLVKAGGQRG